MSRKSRLEALRARRAAGIYSLHADYTPPEPYDPSLGLPVQPVVELPPPIPVPEGLRGSYRTCGACESYIEGEACGYCKVWGR